MTDNMKDAILVTLVAAIMFIVGARWNEVYHTDNSTQLPYCQEDEYLYPDDYEGPGENTVGDLTCVHVDDIALNPHIGDALVMCPDGNVYYKPEEAPC